MFLPVVLSGLILSFPAGHAASIPQLADLRVLAANEVYPTTHHGTALSSRDPDLLVRLIDLRVPSGSPRPAHGFVSQTIFGTMVHLQDVSVLGRVTSPAWVNGARMAMNELIDRYQFTFFGHESSLTGFSFSWAKSATPRGKRDLLARLLTHVRDPALPPDVEDAWRDSITAVYRRQDSWAHRSYSREEGLVISSPFEAKTRLELRAPRLLNKAIALIPNVAVARVFAFDQGGRVVWQSGDADFDLPMANYTWEFDQEQRRGARPAAERIHGELKRMDDALVDSIVRVELVYDYALLAQGKPSTAILRLQSFARSNGIGSAPPRDFERGEIAPLRSLRAHSESSADLALAIGYLENELSREARVLGLEARVESLEGQAVFLTNEVARLGHALGQLSRETDYLRYLAFDALERIERLEVEVSYLWANIDGLGATLNRYRCAEQLDARTSSAMGVKQLVQALTNVGVLNAPTASESGP